MFKNVLFITMLAYLCTEAYAVHYNSSDMHTFLDNKTHGVTVCWWIKGITDSALYCTLCLIIVIQSRHPDPRYGVLGSILFIYHIVSLAMFNYNYSKSKEGYYILLATILAWIIYDLWPRTKGKLKVIK